MPGSGLWCFTFWLRQEELNPLLNVVNNPIIDWTICSPVRNQTQTVARYAIRPRPSLCLWFWVCDCCGDVMVGGVGERMATGYWRVLSLPHTHTLSVIAKRCLTISRYLLPFVFLCVWCLALVLTHKPILGVKQRVTKPLSFFNALVLVQLCFNFFPVNLIF